MRRIKAILKHRLADFAEHRLHRFTHDFDGKQFVIPTVNGIWPRNFGEKWMTALIRRLLVASPGVFVDVGANTGQTLLKLRSVDDQCRYVGLEPNTTCAEYVQRLIQENGFTNAEVVPVGASDHEGLAWLDFYTHDDSDTCASLVGNFRPGLATGTRRCVPIATLDLVRDQMQLPKIGIIKIDVEGAEREALRGMRRTIVSDRPMMVVEVLHAPSEQELQFLAERVEEMTGTFGDLQYALFRIEKTDDDQQIRAITPVASFDVKVWGPESAMWCDYLCAPAERGVI